MTEPLFRTRPALRTALLFGAGILAARSVGGDPSTWLAAAGITTAITLALLGYARKTAGTFWLHGVLILVGGSMHAWNTSSSTASLLRPAYEGEIIRLTGVVDSDVEWKGERQTLVVRTDSLFRSSNVSAAAKRILILVPKKFPVIRESIGCRVTVTGEARSFPGPRNPGEFDYGKFLQLNDIQGIVAIRDSNGYRARSAPSSVSLRSYVGKLQHVLYASFDTLHSREASGFLKGIVLGYRGDLDDDVKQSFTDTGTIHILAVSGSNVAVVALVFVAVLGFLRLKKRWTILAALIGLVVYMLVTGSSPSVERATIMGALLLSAGLFERKSDIYNSLGASALVLMIVNTNTLFDVGFQLSFSAVLSIVWFYPKLEKLIALVPERFEEIKAVDYVLKLFAVSLAAQIGTIPFTAYYFGRISIISLVANLVVVPIAGLNTLIGVAELAFAQVMPWVALSFAAVNDLLIWFLLGFVKAAAGVPFAVAEVANVGAWGTSVYYVACVTLFSLDDPPIFRKGIILLLTLTVVAAGISAASPHRTLRVTMLDVGQGDALMIEFPNGKHLLIDAGSLSAGNDAGARFVVPLLKRSGIHSLDAIVISHAHSDHTGGILSVLSALDVRRIFQGDTAADSHLYRTIMVMAREMQIPSMTVKAGDEISPDPDVRMYVLYPSGPRDSSRNLNNVSVILKLVYGKTTLLFSGDAETEAEERVVRRFGPMLQSDVLKAGHHGSITSSSEGYLDAVHPDVGLVSVGTKNKFRHPSAVVMSRYAAHGALVHRTDLEGAVVLESDGKNWSEVHWKE